MASINEALDTLLAASKVERENIVYVSAAANTTMQHLLVGFDPANILKDPYVPVANFVPLVKASQIGMNVPDYVYMFSSPNVSSFVGGDVTAGVVACGIQQRKKLTLYMDIGTSSEIVIGNSEWMVSAACYARPFFEGIGIKNGMVPMPGAIIDVNIDSKYEASVKTIDEAAPQGICGAGLVSVTASLFLAGIIGRNGKFNSEIHSPNIRKTKDGYEYVIVKAGGSATGEDIVITEKDIENIIQTKAAIYAASCSLGRNVNVEVKDFEQIIVAGCLGISLDIEKAITIGLLPDIPRDRFICVGNSALTGARLVTFSTEMLDDSRTVTQMMTDVELNATVNYIDNYKSALSIPNNDARSFPSIIAKIKRAG
jgi:uncharacterized 2Fe-2S/4Fe-4S cluster protein (DUF4445 family)